MKEKQKNLPLCPIEKKQNKLPLYLLCMAAGVGVFIMIYGLLPLDVTYDDWIFNGYIETDIVQRYAGWLAYRGEASFFPLTFSRLIAFPFGDYTSLADAIPLAELFFKAVEPMLPDTFQFCGLLCCVNLALQGLCSGCLLGLFTDDSRKIFLGSMIFCFSPILLERLFRHTSLSFHWVILLAIYLYFKGNKTGLKWSTTLSFAALAVGCVGLHMYFVPIIIGFFAAYILDNFKIHNRGLWHLTALAGCVLCCLGAASVLGLLKVGTDNTSGYGTMGMNLNALFNPVSLDSQWWVAGKGKLDWSLLLPMRGLANNNIESFNYLGLGVLLALAASVFFALVALVKNPREQQKLWKARGKRHLFLGLFLAFSTLFAVSNVVCAFSYTLFEIPLPQFVLKLANAFRASGRLFWGVNYMLVLWAVLWVSSLFKSKKQMATVLLLAMLAVQMADLSPALYQKHQEFKDRQEYYNRQSTAEVLDFAKGCSTVYFLEMQEDRALCGQLLKNDLANNLWLISRDNYNVDRQTQDQQRAKDALLKGESPYDNAVYATRDKGTAEGIEKTDSFTFTEIDGTYFFKNKG